MLPVVTPEQMRMIDESAPEALETLIARAAWAVAREARDLLDGTYGKRTWVLAGPGNNGADGVESARILRRWGVRCRLIDALRPELPTTLMEQPDLIIDAAFGTGLTRPYIPPEMAAVPVLAVDIPSGVNGLTGDRLGQPMVADRTITFGAHKPGLLFGVVVHQCFLLGRQNIGQTRGSQLEALGRIVVCGVLFLVVVRPSQDKAQV